MDARVPGVSSDRQTCRPTMWLESAASYSLMVGRSGRVGRVERFRPAIVPYCSGFSSGFVSWACHQRVRGLASPARFLALGERHLLGDANPATELDVTFGLALQSSDLPELVQSLSTPGTSSYRHYQSVAWLAGHTGATEATSTAVSVTYVLRGSSATSTPQRRTWRRPSALRRRPSCSGPASGGTTSTARTGLIHTCPV